MKEKTKGLPITIIYKFRGASPEYLLKFPKEFPNCEKVILDTNYRSTDEIIKFSNKVIRQNENRYDKVIRGTGISGNNAKKVISKDMNEEAVRICKLIEKKSKEIPLNEIAVVYRTKMQARAFAEILMNMGIPFQTKDEIPSIYKHWVTRDICAYLSLGIDKKNNGAIERIINRPSRYISNVAIAKARGKDKNLISGLMGEESLQMWQQAKIGDLVKDLNNLKKLESYEALKYIRKEINYTQYINDYAEYRKMSSEGFLEIVDELQEMTKNYPDKREYLERIEYLSTREVKVKREKREEEANGVTLSTMHSVKGLEYDTVFVVGCVEGLVPHEKSRTELELEEERRLFYVAVTRAKRNLTISVVENRYEEEVKESRFIKVKKKTEEEG